MNTIKKATRYVDMVVNTTNTPVNVYASNGEIILLEANRAFTGPRHGVLFITEDFNRDDTIKAFYAGKGRDNADIWELKDKEGLRVYPMRG